jgi:hypothetical protein
MSTYKKLAQGVMPDSVDTIYTATLNGPTIIKAMRFVNTTAGIVTIQLWQDGVTDSELILPAVDVQANGWVTIDDLIIVDVNGTIEAECNTLSAITYTLYGLER